MIHKLELQNPDIAALNRIPASFPSGITLDK
jgi:hypothetical protein